MLLVRVDDTADVWVDPEHVVAVNPDPTAPGFTRLLMATGDLIVVSGSPTAVIMLFLQAHGMNVLEAAEVLAISPDGLLVADPTARP